MTAAYWLQSADETTDDYAKRIWSDLAPERERWVLATVLFDRVVDPDSSKVQSLFQLLNSAIRNNLWGGEIQ